MQPVQVSRLTLLQPRGLGPDIGHGTTRAEQRQCPRTADRRNISVGVRGEELGYFHVVTRREQERLMLPTRIPDQVSQEPFRIVPAQFWRIGKCPVAASLFAGILDRVGGKKVPMCARAQSRGDPIGKILKQVGESVKDRISRRCRSCFVSFVGKPRCGQQTCTPFRAPLQGRGKDPVDFGRGGGWFRVGLGRSRSKKRLVKAVRATPDLAREEGVRLLQKWQVIIVE